VALIEAGTTELRDDDPNENNGNNDAQGQDAGVLPPHLPPDSSRTAPERRCLTRHIIGLIYEQLYALSAAEDLLHVLYHDVLYLGELVLSIGKFIGGWVSVVRVHELRDNRRERPLETVRRTVGKGAGGRSRLGSKLPLKLR